LVDVQGKRLINRQEVQDDFVGTIEHLHMITGIFLPIGSQLS
jgi:hypothetical protein